MRFDLLSLPVIAVMPVYAIVAHPVLENVRLNDLTRLWFSVPLLGWLAFVFFNGLRIFRGSVRSRLIQSATTIAVIPVYALAILILCVPPPIWIRAEQKRKEINAILGFE